MPEPIQDFMAAPDTVPITVSLEPVHNVLNSMYLLTRAVSCSGFDDWIAHTAAALTPEERETHNLVLTGFYYALLPEQSWASFPAYLDYLAALDPTTLRDKMIEAYASLPFLDSTEACQVDGEPFEVKAVLESVDTYLDFLKERFDPTHIDLDLEARAYSYAVDPPAMQELIVSHLRGLWERFLAPEWERVKPMLEDAVTAFQQIDLGNMSKLEAAQAITGQSLESEKWRQGLERAERIIFVPSAHIGPYLKSFCTESALWILFGARLPEGIQFHAPDLSRAAILTRLRALADDNRLRILRLISEKGEQNSQEIMQGLDLSQSAASRHLKQLCAAGYLSERRCNSIKHYRLNLDQIKSTLQAISTFLLSN